MHDDPSVTDLVTSARYGDKKAWDGLVERYAPLIWSICRRYRLGGADAEDVGQAVWMRLVEHLDNLRDSAALPGWLATTTRRECCRVLRATCKLPADGQVLQNMPDEQAATAEHEVLMAERTAAMREAFARLPPRGQQLLAMLIADPPVPYTEISDRLGIPVGSIGPNRHRYLDRLRRAPAIARLIDAEAGAKYGKAPTTTASRVAQLHAQGYLADDARVSSAWAGGRARNSGRSSTARTYGRHPPAAEFVIPGLGARPRPGCR